MIKKRPETVTKTVTTSKAVPAESVSGHDLDRGHVHSARWIQWYLTLTRCGAGVAAERQGRRGGRRAVPERVQGRPPLGLVRAPSLLL